MPAELTTPDGKPINAVYGFIAMLRRLIKKQDPYYLAIAFDSKGPTFRHSSFKDYKANRKTMPDDLQSQIPLLEKLIRAYNIPMFALQGYEADDVIGTIVKKISKENIETIIVTKDKDIEQLIDEHVKIFDEKNNVFYDAEMCEKKRGVKPSQMIEVLALAGDSSDNVPGVPGIGGKTAVKLIKEWNSVESVLANTDKISGEKVKENLVQFADQAKLSKFLVTIKTDIPIEFDLETCRMDGVNNEELNILFKEYGFNSFLI